MGSITEGASGFADAIKAKIKANEESRVSGTIIDSLEARIAQNAAKSGNAGELEGFSKSFDALRKAKLSASETLAVAKAIAPDMFSTDAKTKGAFMVKTDPNTNETYTVNAITGEKVEDASVISGNAAVFKETLTPEAMAARTGATKAEETQARFNEEARKVAGGLRTLAVGFKQFEEAFPSDGKTPLQQRIGGVIEGNLAKAGFRDNAEMVGAQAAVIANARKTVKSWGDSGALAIGDVKDAEIVLNQADKTFAEKMAVFKAVGEQAIASMDDETLDQLFKKQPYTKDMLDAFGISYGEDMRNKLMGAFKVKAPAKSGSGESKGKTIGKFKIVSVE